jgi:ABC-2 type transport system permease protein
MASAPQLHPASSFLRTYAKVFDIGLQNTFVYRWNFLLRMVFGIVPLVGTVFLWKAVFKDADGASIEGYDYQGMIFYFLITVFIDNLITPTEDEWQIAGEIREGRMSSYLTKPLNYLAYRFTLYASYRLLYISVVFIPIVCLAWIFRDAIRWPEHGVTWAALALSTAMAAGLQFLIAYALAMIAFWVLEVSTIIFIVYSFEYFLSGHVFPLDVMPAWLQGFVKWSPFTYELFFPAQIAMERVQGRALVEGLCIQAGWLVLAYLAARFLWSRGVRKYQAFGG